MSGARPPRRFAAHNTAVVCSAWQPSLPAHLVVHGVLHLLDAQAGRALILICGSGSGGGGRAARRLWHACLRAHALRNQVLCSLPAPRTAAPVQPTTREMVTTPLRQPSLGWRRRRSPCRLQQWSAKSNLWRQGAMFNVSVQQAEGFSRCGGAHNHCACPARPLAAHQHWHVPLACAATRQQARRAQACR